MQTEYLNARAGQYTAYLRRREQRWLSRLIGFPIYTQDFQGAVRKTRARRLPTGNISIGNFYSLSQILIGYADGTFRADSYLSRWWYRETWLG